MEEHNILYSYGTLTEKIINRSGTDICPMEKTVANINDIEIGYIKLKEKLTELKSK